MEVKPEYIVVALLAVGYVWYRLKKHEEEEEFFEQDDD